MSKTYGTQQVADKVGVHKNTVLAWCDKGDLRPDIDHRGWRVFSKIDLDMAYSLAREKKNG